MASDEKRDAYRKKVEAQLREWDAKMDQLQAKMDKAEADAQIEYQSRLQDLRTKQAAAQQKLAELSAAGADAWKELQDGVDRATSELKKSMESAWAKLG